jgi:hypothetical protein
VHERIALERSRSSESHLPCVRRRPRCAHSPVPKFIQEACNGIMFLNNEDEHCVIRRGTSKNFEKLRARRIDDLADHAVL